MIRAGTLDRLIDIVALPLRTGSGFSAVVQEDINSVTTWTTVFAGIRANVKDIAGAEELLTDKVRSDRTAAFITRYTLAIKEYHFIRYRSEIWRIERIEEMGRREGLRIVATKITK